MSVSLLYSLKRLGFKIILEVEVLIMDIVQVKQFSKFFRRFTSRCFREFAIVRQNLLQNSGIRFQSLGCTILSSPVINNSESFRRSSKKLVGMSTDNRQTQTI